MMDRAKLLERTIPERYVAGQLTAEEAAEFEEYLLEHPEVIDEVEAARQLRLGLRTLSERGNLPETLQSRPAPRTWWLMAAGIAAAVVCAMLVTLRPAPERVLAESLARLSATLRENQIAGEYMLVKTRGAPVEITLPKSPAPVMISLESPRDADSTAYSVGLVCGGKTVAVANDVRANAEGMLVVFLDPSTLTRGACEFHAESGAAKQFFPVRFITAGH